MKLYAKFLATTAVAAVLLAAGVSAPAHAAYDAAVDVDLGVITAPVTMTGAELAAAAGCPSCTVEIDEDIRPGVWVQFDDAWSFESVTFAPGEGETIAQRFILQDGSPTDWADAPWVTLTAMGGLGAMRGATGVGGPDDSGEEDPLPAPDALELSTISTTLVEGEDLTLTAAEILAGAGVTDATGLTLVSLAPPIAGVTVVEADGAVQTVTFAAGAAGTTVSWAFTVAGWMGSVLPGAVIVSTVPVYVPSAPCRIVAPTLTIAVPPSSPTVTITQSEIIASLELTGCEPGEVMLETVSLGTGAAESDGVYTLTASAESSAFATYRAFTAGGASARGHLDVWLDTALDPAPEPEVAPEDPWAWAWTAPVKIAVGRNPVSGSDSSATTTRFTATNAAEAGFGTGGAGRLGTRDDRAACVTAAGMATETRVVRGSAGVMPTAGFASWPTETPGWASHVASFSAVVHTNPAVVATPTEFVLDLLHDPAFSECAAALDLAGPVYISGADIGSKTNVGSAYDGITPTAWGSLDGKVTFLLSKDPTHPLTPSFGATAMALTNDGSQVELSLSIQFFGSASWTPELGAADHTFDAVVGEPLAIAADALRDGAVWTHASAIPALVPTFRDLPTGVTAAGSGVQFTAESVGVTTFAYQLLGPDGHASAPAMITINAADGSSDDGGTDDDAPDDQPGGETPDGDGASETPDDGGVPPTAFPGMPIRFETGIDVAPPPIARHVLEPQRDVVNVTPVLALAALLAALGFTLRRRRRAVEEHR